MRKRASRPIRCVLVDAGIIIVSVIGIVVPETTGSPVTLGVALEVLVFVVEGIGAGTEGVAGVAITGAG